MIYRDRRHAGASLAERLLESRSENPLVLALPGGGVPVAFEIARELNAPLDLILVRELRAPGAEQGVVFGALSGEDIELDPQAIARLNLSKGDVESIIAHEQKELKRSACHFQIVRRAALVEGRSVILVDDGLSSAFAARVAIASLRRQHPRKITFAVPVCAPGAAAAVTGLVEGLTCGAIPERYGSRADWYRDFAPVPEDDIVGYLVKAGVDPAGSLWRE